MRITILALGSHGDVQPFVPLGQALQAAGHRVTIATFALFAPMIHAAGLEFYPLRGDAQTLLNLAATSHSLTKRPNPVQLVRALHRSYGSLAQTLPTDLSSLPATDLILNQLPSHLFGGDLAEYLGIPWAIVTVIPLARTRVRPLIGFPTTLARLPGYNLLTYRIGEQVGWQLFRTAVNRVRTQVWKLPPRSLWGPFEAIHADRIPFICGFSEHVVPRAPDWGPHVHLTGWWYPHDPDWIPSVDLQRFLASGAPPVFIGFGSMPVRDPAAVTARIVEAVQLSGQRAILHAGWAGLGGQGLPSTIFRITHAPYAWLFPRMAAIVHHGGSGTTGFSFRSGVPTLIVPFGFDQFDWGARAAELGVGPAPLPFRRLTAERLATAIGEAVSDAAMQQRAAVLGQALSDEQGVAKAVAIIERL